MEKRTVEELNLLDDFLFYKMVNNPDFGEEFSRELLRIILGKEVGKLQVFPQKAFYGSEPETHGARLDVYLEEDAENGLENATLYDIEPESPEKKESVKSLARRTRFYHSKIDVGNLKSGQDYADLKNVLVIFILSRDPFSQNRMVYTVANRCLEVPELPYDDGARTLFLYTKGTEGNPRKELRELLEYMENSSLENVTNDSLKRIHQMTKVVKSNREVSIEYMKVQERERMLKQIGYEQGERSKLREMVKKKLDKNKSVEVIAEELEEEIEVIQEIIKSMGIEFRR